MLSNFLIGWGVCAWLYSPAAPSARRSTCSSEGKEKGGKKCDELRGSLWYAAWISVGSMKIFFFPYARWEIHPAGQPAAPLFALWYKWCFPEVGLRIPSAVIGSNTALLLEYVNMIISLEDKDITLHTVCACPQRECTEKLLYWPFQHRGMDWIYLHNWFPHLTVSYMNEALDAWDKERCKNQGKRLAKINFCGKFNE